MTKARVSRHGKPCKPSTVRNPGYTASTLRRGVTARELVASGRAPTLRQARAMLRAADRRAAAA